MKYITVIMFLISFFTIFLSMKLSFKDLEEIEEEYGTSEMIRKIIGELG